MRTEHRIRRAITHARKGTLLRAIKFKMGYALPAGDTYYGSKAERYDARRQGLPIWHAEQDAMQALLAALPMGLSVCDVPFGTGRFVPLYVERRMRIAGLDGSPDMIARAREKYGDELLGCDIRVGTAVDLPWPNNSFDLTTCFRFLSHIVTFGEAKASIREQVRVSRKHVILEMGVRDRARWLASVPDSRRLGDQLTDTQMRSLLSDLGLSVIEAVFLSENASSRTGIYLCEKSGG